MTAAAVTAQRGSRVPSPTRAGLTAPGLSGGQHATCPAGSREPSNRQGNIVRLGSRCRSVLRVARRHGIDGGAVLRDHQEMWLPVPIPGSEDRYEVSSRARVRSVKTGRILKTPCTGKDYPMVEIDGRTYRVHILMAEAFLGPRPPGLIALHHNDIKRDGRICNVRFGTRSDNYADAIRNGRRPFGRTAHIRSGAAVDD